MKNIIIGFTNLISNFRRLIFNYIFWGTPDLLLLNKSCSKCVQNKIAKKRVQKTTARAYDGPRRAEEAKMSPNEFSKGAQRMPTTIDPMSKKRILAPGGPPQN